MLGEHIGWEILVVLPLFAICPTHPVPETGAWARQMNLWSKPDLRLLVIFLNLSKI